MTKTIHVIGTGVIGLPLISLLNRHKKDFGFDEVTFHKNTPLKTDIASIKQLIKDGAILTSDVDKINDFIALGAIPAFDSREQAIKRADVVIDCTPKGFGLKNKQKYYDKFKDKKIGFIAQGSEAGFGIPFAYGINDKAIKKEEQFIQVVSCNTHNISAIMNAFKYYSPNGDFVCIRRASDISQNDDFSPGIKVDSHKYDSGTHHAVDVKRVFETIGEKVKVYSSSCIVSTQYMHAIRFKLTVPTSVDSKEEVISMLETNKLIAFTEKNTSNSIFSFGRDHGHFGRILNQTVICRSTIEIIPWDGNNASIVGYCFTPQDANSLVSSVAATLWFLYKDWNMVKEKMKCLDKYLFREI